MHTKSELTIIIPSRNAANSTANLLMSLVLQDYPLMSSTCVYLVDSSPTDRTAEIVCSFSQWLDIMVIRDEFADLARRVGVGADTRYLLLIDPEVEIYDSTLIRRTIEIAKQRRVHCATTNVRCVHGKFHDHFLYLTSNFLQKLSRLHRPFSTGTFLLLDRAVFEGLVRSGEEQVSMQNYFLKPQIARSKFTVISGRVATRGHRLQQLGFKGLIRRFLDPISASAAGAVAATNG